MHIRTLAREDSGNRRTAVAELHLDLAPMRQQIFEKPILLNLFPAERIDEDEDFDSCVHKLAISGYKFFWKQPKQLVKTTPLFSKLFLSIVMAVSFSTKFTFIYIPLRSYPLSSILYPLSSNSFARAAMSPGGMSVALP